MKSGEAPLPRLGFRFTLSRLLRCSSSQSACKCGGVIASCPERGALSVEGETGKCYPPRPCPDKLRPAFRMVRQEPACEFGSGPRWSKEWWRGVHHPATPLSSIVRIEGSG